MEEWESAGTIAEVRDNFNSLPPKLPSRHNPFEFILNLLASNKRVSLRYKKYINPQFHKKNTISAGRFIFLILILEFTRCCFPPYPRGLGNTAFFLFVMLLTYYISTITFIRRLRSIGCKRWFVRILSPVLILGTLSPLLLGLVRLDYSSLANKFDGFSLFVFDNRDIPLSPKPPRFGKLYGSYAIVFFGAEKQYNLYLWGERAFRLDTYNRPQLRREVLSAMPLGNEVYGHIPLESRLWHPTHPLGNLLIHSGILQHDGRWRSLDLTTGMKVMAPEGYFLDRQSLTMRILDGCRDLRFLIFLVICFCRVPNP